MRRVREVDSKGRFVGGPLVGKETQYIEDMNNQIHPRKFYFWCKLLFFFSIIYEFLNTICINDETYHYNVDMRNGL